MKTLSKITSVLTVAPIMAFVALTALYLGGITRPYGIAQYLLSIFCLAVLPVLAYPLQKLLPKYRNTGRDGQRKLAFIMVLAGYTLAVVCVLLFEIPAVYVAIYFGYFLSGVLLTVINRFTNLKASGHACGVAGPAVLLIYFFGIPGLLFALTIPIVFWARLKMGRHTLRELILGASSSLACTFLSLAVIL